MAGYVLALDQGTTSSRALLFDPEGRVCGIEQQEFSQIYPQPGWVEHAPEDIWSSQVGVVAKLLRACRVAATDIAALGISNQRETTILWDRATGRPVANALVWQDRRTAPLCEELRAAGAAPLVYAKTGLPLDPYFSAAKIRWLLDNVEGLRMRAQRGEIAFGTVDTFLLWRLSGGAIHATDVSNAARTQIFNIVTREWDPELLDLFGVPREVLPEVRPSSCLYGEARASLWGAPIEIGGVAGDQQAATFGQACLQPGMVKNTYGTGCFMLMNTGSVPQFSSSGLLTTVAWEIGGRVTYALEGSVFVAGAAVQWLRDSLQILHTAAEIEALAASVPDTGGVTFVPAFVGLGTPYWDPGARGALLGLTRGTSRAHIARATLEAVCFQTCDVLAAMRRDGGLEIAELRVDGGMTANTMLLQMQADLLDTTVVRPAITETSALGAAYLAGLAAGVWRDISEIAALWAAETVFRPQLDAGRRRVLMQEWHRAVERTRTNSPDASIP